MSTVPFALSLRQTLLLQARRALQNIKEIDLVTNFVKEMEGVGSKWGTKRKDKKQGLVKNKQTQMNVRSFAI